MHLLITNNLPSIYKLCDKYKVKRLFAFGSIVSDNFIPGKSDIDFYVELLPMSPIERGDSLIELWDNLEMILNSKIDLITDQPIKNQIFNAEVDKTKRLIYDREKQEILV